MLSARTADPFVQDRRPGPHLATMGRNWSNAVEYLARRRSSTLKSPGRRGNRLRRTASCGVSAAIAASCVLSLLAGCGGGNGSKLRSMQAGNCHADFSAGSSDSTYWADPLTPLPGHGTPPNMVTGTAALTENNGLVDFCLSNFTVSPAVDVVIDLIGHKTVSTVGIVSYVVTAKQLATGTSFVAKQVIDVDVTLGYAIVSIRQDRRTELASTDDTGHFPNS